jgi:hypothetical protein
MFRGCVRTIFDRGSATEEALLRAAHGEAA